MSAANCPTDETLCALVARALDEVETVRVGAHIDHCAECQDLVIAVIRGRGAAPTLAAGTPATGTPMLSADVPTLSLRGPALPWHRPTLPSCPAHPSQVHRGARIGRYVVRAQIGAGGMGIVYEAYDAELDRAIALKVMRPELVAGQADRLVRESRLMARVVHRSVITVYDAGRAGDTLFIAMELVRGETLGRYLRTKRPWRDILRIFEHAGRGLEAAHAAGVVHRDFKPENVLLQTAHDQVTRVLVTDFGIARATAFNEELRPYGVSTADVALTAVGSAIGTPAYMAPEQHTGERVDARADVFAFCASLWEALFGQRPFPGVALEEIRAAMLHVPRPPRNVVPRRLVRALQRGLAADPAERWPDMTSLLRVLRAVRSRWRIAVASASAIGLVWIGIAAALFAQPDSADPCAAGLAAIDVAYSDRDAVELQHVFGLSQNGLHVLADVGAKKRAWRDVHLATCRAKQPSSATAGCLEARRIELAGYVDDVIADRGANAFELGLMLGDPQLCAAPPSGLLAARMPADAALRRKVTAIRHKLLAMGRARFANDYVLANQIFDEAYDAGHTLWPPLRAEMLLMRGSIELVSDLRRAGATLREAAAHAESIHYDYVAVTAWTHLVELATYAEANPARALEYATYAEAAVTRVGRPPAAVALLAYNHGTALVEADRVREGAVLLREAVAIAESSAPAVLNRALQGLAYLYESKGQYEEAIATYRRAAEHTGKPEAVTAMFGGRLAIDLAMIGRFEEAERTVRDAIVAAGNLDENSLVRKMLHLDLAYILQQTHRSREALAVAEPAARDIARIQGERSEHYGQALQCEGSILMDLGRTTAAERKLARACDLLAFHAGDSSTPVALCNATHAGALAKLSRKPEARALLARTIPILTSKLGDDHRFTREARQARDALR